MEDLPGMIATALVVVALLMTAVIQVRPLRRGRHLLDLAALAPEWKFFAQASLKEAADVGRDPHIVIRDRQQGEHEGGWRPVMWPSDRRLLHALWNPQRRVKDPILSFAEDLAGTHGPGPSPGLQQSIGYLVVLRTAMLAPNEQTGVVDRQFAVVHTLGRTTDRVSRSISIDFISAWHRC